MLKKGFPEMSETHVEETQLTQVIDLWTRCQRIEQLLGTLCELRQPPGSVNVKSLLAFIYFPNESPLTNSDLNFFM